MGDGPRYEFSPLERRGVILGLDPAQLLGMAATLILALVVRAALPAPAGTGGGVLVALTGIVAAVWTREGRPIAAHAFTGAAWLLRRGWQPRLGGAPTTGRALTGPGLRRDRPGPASSGDLVPWAIGDLAPAGIELFEDPGPPGEGSLGLVRDRRNGGWVAVMPVGAGSFVLLDPAEQAQRLEGWRRVLAALARPGSPVVRVQWIQRSWTPGPAPSGTGSAAPGADRAHPAAAASYARLEQVAGHGMTHRRAWLVVVVRAGHGPAANPAGRRRQAAATPAGRRRQAAALLRRELRLLDGQLRAADLDPLPPLDGGGLASLVSGGPPDGGQGPSAGTVSGPVPRGPLATADRWSEYRADGFRHVTYWVAEWPRVQVGPDFLSPLLLGGTRCAVAVVMAPVPLDRAVRQVRSARTADMADAELRARAGFLPSTRRQRESEGAVRREAELADGHQDFRFSGYVTVSAPDRDQLQAACASVEHAAQSAHLELRRLYGRQQEAYTWTLPLGRGLR